MRQSLVIAALLVVATIVQGASFQWGPVWIGDTDPTGDHVVAGQLFVNTSSGLLKRRAGSWVTIAQDPPADTSKFWRGDGTWATVQAGGGAPTGTGFRHVTSGSEDASSKLVDTADVNDAQITFAKIQSISQDRVLGRATVGTGGVEQIACTAAGRSLIAGADAAAQRTTLGLGTMATAATAFIQRDVLTSGTGATFNTPTGATVLRVRMIGAGGGGGGADGSTSNAGCGGGGGAGGYVEEWITSPAATYTYTVPSSGGAGGLAGNNAGTGGSNTTFGSFTASGGGGGTSTAAGNTAIAVLGGAGGAAASGDVNCPGSPGSFGMRLSATVSVSGLGSDSKFGGGGAAVLNAAGAAATGFGAGGGGASTQGNTDRAGGAGSPGLVIVEAFR